MRKLLLASAIALAPFAAHAIQIINAAQTSGSNTVDATVNGAATQTTISITDAAVDVAQIATSLAVPFAAIANLTATSIDAATGIGPALLQHYDGSFCISSGPGCTGTDYLSGTFIDAAFGLATGSQLSVNITNPPDTLSMTSGVGLPTGSPSSLTFAMSNLIASPPFSGGLQIDNTTIAPFTASFVETANAAPIAEPASLGLLSVGLAGLWAVSRRRRDEIAG